MLNVDLHVFKEKVVLYFSKHIHTNSPKRDHGVPAIFY